MEAPRVTAVVTAYWPERFAQVHQIVADIMNGTVKPDTIIVLNNNLAFRDALGLPEWAEWDVRVVSGFNTETRGKYIVGMLSFADFYLLMDDDMSVGPKTLEFLLGKAYPELLTANRGVIMTDESFYRGQLVDADRISERTVVTSICGSGVFASHKALVNILDAERRGNLRRRWPTQGDDILAGLANPGNTIIFPMIGGAAWRTLSEQGVAMNHAPGYYEMRDEFVADAQRSLA